MKILGIDYGEAKIGLAISEGKIASPIGAIDTKIWKTGIGEICERENIERIIVGISEGKMAEKTKKFGQILEKTAGLPVEYWEETLTSKEAVKKMIEAGKARKRRKMDEHAVSACLILQDYLDNLSNG